MGFCTNCGAKLSEGAKFCQCCGTKVASAPESANAAAKPVSDGEVFVCGAQEYDPPVRAVRYEELPVEKKSSLAAPIIAFVSSVLFIIGLILPDSPPLFVLFLPLMLIFGIIGLIKSIKGRRAIGIVFSAAAISVFVFMILALIVYLIAPPHYAEEYNLMKSTIATALSDRAPALRGRYNFNH